MKYITNKGDTFDSIAFAAYGDEELITQLIAANPQYTETAVFDYGVPLEIPDIDKTDSDVYLPPWRQ
jgi:phage tail protein X